MNHVTPLPRIQILYGRMNAHSFSDAIAKFSRYIFMAYPKLFIHGAALARFGQELR